MMSVGEPLSWMVSMAGDGMRTEVGLEAISSLPRIGVAEVNTARLKIRMIVNIVLGLLDSRNSYVCQIHINGTATYFIANMIRTNINSTMTNMARANTTVAILFYNYNQRDYQLNQD